MIALEAAVARLVEEFPRRTTSFVQLNDALDLVLAESIYAGDNIPHFARSGMDGYAVRAADLGQAGREHPVALQLIGRVVAGHLPPGRVEPGTAIAITTGAALPEGADAVVRLEVAQEEGDRVLLFHSPKAGDHVAYPGEDVTKGDLVLGRGHRLRPQEIGLLASLGYGRVPVYPRPKVALITTGDELVTVEEQPGPCQIRNSGAHCLSAMIRQAGGEPVYLGAVRDDLEAIRSRLRQAREYDLIITSGGVSVGEKDLLPAVMASLGAEELFWKVALKPGTPVYAARWGSRVLLGLSGNPAAALTTFDLLGRPVIHHLLGRDRLGLREAQAVLAEPITKPAGIRRFLRARVFRGAEGQLMAEVGMTQRSGVLSTMVLTNGYVDLPPTPEGAPAGLPVRVLLYEGEEAVVCGL